MRRDNHIVQIPQWAALGQGLGFENIERRT